jgi:hypothetical protein
LTPLRPSTLFTHPLSHSLPHLLTTNPLYPTEQQVPSSSPLFTPHYTDHHLFLSFLNPLIIRGQQQHHLQSIRHK